MGAPVRIHDKMRHGKTGRSVEERESIEYLLHPLFASPYQACPSSRQGGHVLCRAFTLATSNRATLACTESGRTLRVETAAERPRSILHLRGVLR